MSDENIIDFREVKQNFVSSPTSSGVSQDGHKMQGFDPQNWLELVSRSALPDTAKTLAEFLCPQATDHGNVRCTLSQMAEFTSVTPQTVNRYLGYLVRDGFVQRVGQGMLELITPEEMLGSLTSETYESGAESVKLELYEALRVLNLKLRNIEMRQSELENMILSALDYAKFKHPADSAKERGERGDYRGVSGERSENNLEAFGFVSPKQKPKDSESSDFSEIEIWRIDETYPAHNPAILDEEEAMQEVLDLFTDNDASLDRKRDALPGEVDDLLNQQQALDPMEDVMLKIVTYWNLVCSTAGGQNQLQPWRTLTKSRRDMFLTWMTLDGTAEHKINARLEKLHEMMEIVRNSRLAHYPGKSRFGLDLLISRYSKLEKVREALMAGEFGIRRASPYQFFSKNTEMMDLLKQRKEHWQTGFQDWKKEAIG